MYSNYWKVWPGIKPMDKYVVSLELAEKLKAAGYRQTEDGRSTSYFVWATWMEGESEVRAAKDTYGSYIAAPMGDELLEQLPKENQKLGYLELCQDGQNWMPRYVKVPRTTIWIKNLKPADALAELWLWCKKNGHV